METCAGPPVLPLQRGVTAMLAAALYGHFDAVHVLLDAGADVAVQSRARSVRIQSMLVMRWALR